MQNGEKPAFTSKQAGRVLGVDPGSHHLGWGVVDVRGSCLTHVASGTLHAPAEELVTRLCYLGCALEALLDMHRPDAASVEGIFHARNSRSALILGHARGTVLYCLGRRLIPVHEYTPGQIKQANTGRGAAQKEQVQAMVLMLLGLTHPIELDTSDALAAAICHTQHADRLDRRSFVPTQTAGAPPRALAQDAKPLVPRTSQCPRESKLL